MTLRVKQQDLQAMLRHCEETYPSEACGILLGKIGEDERRVTQMVSCRNVANDPLHRYSIDPLELIRVQRQARDAGLEILGFYHSHPDHPARPSPTDLEDAHWIDYSYIITSVEQGKAGETQSFFLSGTREEDKRFTAEDLLIT